MSGDTIVIVMPDLLWKLDAVSLGARLANVTVEIRRGITAIIGYSGAGKTSLIQLLVGMERPDRGLLETRCRPFWVPQNGGLWPHVTARGHLEIAGAREVQSLLAAFDLEHRGDAKPGCLSEGECSRLAVARALATGADVLVMDEPLVHVDPSRVGRYWDVIRTRIAETGTSLVFATHLPGDALGEAEHALCLKRGRLLYDGSIDALYNRPESRELAECLGPTNWFEADEARRWLGEGHAEGSYRPERIEVAMADANRGFVVVSSRFRGSVAEVTLRSATGPMRTILHRPSDPWLGEGMYVRLRVRNRSEELVA